MSSIIARMLPGPYYPRSFTMLIIVAMGVLIVPLASGLINAVHVLQGVVDTQRQFTRNSLAITRDVRQVVESVSQFQRAAGQYHLLQDTEFGPALKMRFDELQNLIARLNGQLVDPPSRATLALLATRSHALYRQLQPGARMRIAGHPQLGRAALKMRFDELQDLIARLNEQLVDPASRATLGLLATRSRALYRQLQPGAFLDSAQFHALEPTFDDLHDSARTLLSQADTAVQHELQALETIVKSTRQRLIMLALALIPLTILLAAVFSWMINRPIKQLKASIQQLGRANLDPLPAISGPQDMIELGREIDWLRQRLQALEEQKLRFLRHVSHELKTPLASLREGVGLLHDELAGSLNIRQRSIVDIMDSSSRELQKRIEDLLRYGNLVRHDTAPPATPQSLAEALSAVRARHRLTLAARRIQVDTQLEAASLHVDRNQLEIVLDNLLSNAIKFSPEGGRILVSSARVDGAVDLWVCDQGSGIPDSDRSRIFEPFFQGSHQPDSAIKGSGLGLSIVREYLLDAGGRIEVIDRAPWSTCFRLTWPLPR